MNMNLLGTLGLDKVESDPNAIPDGKYDGDVFKSEYVLSKNKDTVSHVITFRVTEGANKGAQRQSWYTLGSEPRNAEGEFPSKPEDITTYNPTMSESQKSWYKKMFVDLGIPEADVSSTPISALVGKNVTFGIKRNGSYININFVELRTPTNTTDGGSGSVSLGF